MMRLNNVRAAELDPIILFSNNKLFMPIRSDILNIFKALRSGDVLYLEPTASIHFSKPVCILSNYTLPSTDNESQP